MFTTALLLQEDRLTIGEIVGNIPHDGSAFLVYALVGAFVFLIWYGNRKSSQNASAQSSSSPSAGAAGTRPQSKSAQRGGHRHSGR